MTEKPLNFKGWEVNAALAGRKTMFRRVLKRPTDHFHASYTHAKVCNDTVMWWDGVDPRNGRLARIPYTVGDVLWVREAFYAHEGGTIRDPGSGHVIDHIDPEIEYKADRKTPGGRWKSSIHMPRWASRITLKVVGVKVERLQDISDEDARAEGAPYDDGDMQFPSQKAPPGANYIEDGWDSARDWFTDTWNIIHGPGAWDANPWCAAYSFRRVAE